MDTLLKASEAVATSSAGLVMALVLLLGVVLWAYWQERQQNRTVAEQRLTEAREDTEAMVSALSEATRAVEQFKASNDALKTTIEVLVQLQQRRAGP